MAQNSTQWICCQIGAREHYAIPHTLYQNHKLISLITDTWVTPQSLIGKLPTPFFNNLKDRFHLGLSTASIRAFTRSSIQFEIACKFQKISGWQQVIARNSWFQKRAIQSLKSLIPQLNRQIHAPILFTYSYAALELLEFARSQGWKTVLGQIDPGLVEEKIVVEAHQNHPELAPFWQPAPLSYWENWKKECEIADQILVNSHWSKLALEKVGVLPEKINTISLAYAPSEAIQKFKRMYPSQFSVQRPLKVLFLGQIILRKGIAELLEAARLLQDQPIEFWLVGSLGIERSHLALPNVSWLGPVPRSQVIKYYQQADLFLFPTLSDGFGLTQLEAQSWNLPIISSRFCGEVVKDQENGIILSEVSGSTIAQTLRFCLQHPEKLTQFAKSSNLLTEFNFHHLYSCLQTLAD